MRCCRCLEPILPVAPPVAPLVARPVATPVAALYRPWHSILPRIQTISFVQFFWKLQRLLTTFTTIDNFLSIIRGPGVQQVALTWFESYLHGSTLHTRRRSHVPWLHSHTGVPNAKVLLCNLCYFFSTICTIIVWVTDRVSSCGRSTSVVRMRFRCFWRAERCFLVSVLDFSACDSSDLDHLDSIWSNARVREYVRRKVGHTWTARKPSFLNGKCAYFVTSHSTHRVYLRCLCACFALSVTLRGLGFGFLKLKLDYS